MLFSDLVPDFPLCVVAWFFRLCWQSPSSRLLAPPLPLSSLSLRVFLSFLSPLSLSLSLVVRARPTVHRLDGANSQRLPPPVHRTGAVETFFPRIKLKYSATVARCAGPRLGALAFCSVPNCLYISGQNRRPRFAGTEPSRPKRHGLLSQRRTDSGQFAACSGDADVLLERGCYVQRVYCVKGLPREQSVLSFGKWGAL